MSDRWQEARLPDLLAPALDILFVGINPGRQSALSGHHFAGPGNAFWRLLLESGLTSRLFAPAEDALLPSIGIGVTNIVARPSRGEGDLSGAELAAGAARVRERTRALGPRVVALLGRRVADALAGQRTVGVWGELPVAGLLGRTFVLPNPSARSTVPYAARLQAFRAVCCAARAHLDR